MAQVVDAQVRPASGGAGPVPVAVEGIRVHLHLLIAHGGEDQAGWGWSDVFVEMGLKLRAQVRWDGDVPDVGLGLGCADLDLVPDTDEAATRADDAVFEVQVAASELDHFPEA